jgi:hypothetical protein
MISMEDWQREFNSIIYGDDEEVMDFEEKEDE